MYVINNGWNWYAYYLRWTCCMTFLFEISDDDELIPEWLIRKVIKCEWIFGFRRYFICWFFYNKVIFGLANRKSETKKKLDPCCYIPFFVDIPSFFHQVSYQTIFDMHNTNLWILSSHSCTSSTLWCAALTLTISSFFLKYLHLCVHKHKVCILYAHVLLVAGELPSS